MTSPPRRWRTTDRTSHRDPRSHVVHHARYGLTAEMGHRPKARVMAMSIAIARPRARASANAVSLICKRMVAKSRSTAACSMGGRKLPTVSRTTSAQAKASAARSGWPSTTDRLANPSKVNATPSRKSSSTKSFWLLSKSVRACSGCPWRSDTYPRRTRIQELAQISPVSSAKARLSS
jgi:hypothetical protein